ncbi:histidinol-phosphatase [Cordyceps fumosorosea ARSEF 2679]|uniref:Histidinol-phosphatase n=1 Tax=Cordyceps fumosorosea (strain ARSEF 2679) TaxID=1081104 RepID=A0A167RLU4_CORFA|nr:histidinol-phosphatase [Cordyceps fumosorosea ARSEF 2679]OAA58722.1 histidinol-phosphatase [Cordyceps fumosorosea ARSEF 2679]
MAFTMHSHSGQFCGHAVDQLEDIIKHAISVGYKTIGLTEHMPRYEARDLYPEELADGPDAALAALPLRHEAYLAEALRLQSAYAAQIHVLIGFEAEFIRSNFATHVAELFAAAPCLDYFIGSVHHVHGVPIDYDAASMAAAVAASSRTGDPAGGTEEALHGDYYDLQHEMLRALRPRVVGHFDLIRLLSAEPGRDPRGWEGVWARIVRNLRLAAEQGAWLECNSAALRKGLAEPYPCRAIAEEWLRLGGKFTLSDDSHGVAHVATNYLAAVRYLQDLGVEHVWTFRRGPHPWKPGHERARLEDVAVPLAEIRAQFEPAEEK